MNQGKEVPEGGGTAIPGTLAIIAYVHRAATLPPTVPYCPPPELWRHFRQHCGDRLPYVHKPSRPVG